MVRTRIRVIALDSDTARRERFRAAAAAAEVEWQFFSAHRTPAAPLRYDRDLAMLQCGRALGPGEIGCYTSHYKAWEDFIASDADQAIILEDDVIVDWPLLTKLAAWDCAANGIDLLRFYSTHPFAADTMVHRFLSQHSHLVRVRGIFHGTQGYLVTRRGAQALLATGPVIAAPVDGIMARYWVYGLPNYCLFPFPILERYAPSTIEHTRQAAMPLSPGDQARHLSWRIQNRARRAYADARMAKRNPFAQTGDVGMAFVDRRAAAQPAKPR